MKIGIDKDMFQEHSIRSASTSRASFVGISLNEIVKRGQWASDSNLKSYKKRYHRKGWLSIDFTKI